MIKPIIESMTVTPGGGSTVSSGGTKGSTQAANQKTGSSSAGTSSKMNPESIFEPRESKQSASSGTSTKQSKIPSPVYFQAKDVQQDIKIIKEAFQGCKQERRYVVVLGDMEKLLMKGKSVTIRDDYMHCIGMCL